jgi:hypothetical protein
LGSGVHFVAESGHARIGNDPAVLSQLEQGRKKVSNANYVARKIGAKTMWIVRLALRRPYTFVVMSILILVMGGLAIVRTPTDIFPNINIPVVSIIWTYNVLIPQDMADRIVTITERNLTTTVDNIEHIESQPLCGIAVVKVFLQPTANIQQGIAQVTANSQTQHSRRHSTHAEKAH